MLKYSFIKEIESNRSYEFLSKEFKKNKKVFESLVSELRLESLNTLYKGDYTYSFKEFIEKTVNKNKWSTELNIISIMILLNRSILCYFKGTSGTVNRYRYDLPQVKNKDNPIRIGIMDNHFFPLFSTADFISELYYNETDFLALVKEIDIKII